jgi:hypothetical protein
MLSAILIHVNVYKIGLYAECRYHHCLYVGVRGPIDN